MRRHDVPYGFWFFLFGLLLIFVAILGSFQKVAAGEAVTATYTRGVLQVTIPYQVPRAGNGQLIAEVLDPEDTVLGRVERHVDVGTEKSSWQAEIKLTKPIAVDDLVWHRLRYRFAYRKEGAVEGTESISQIVRMPVIHILGQQSYLTGGPAAVRVIVTDSKNETIAGAPARFGLSLTPGFFSQGL